MKKFFAIFCMLATLIMGANAKTIKVQWPANAIDVTGADPVELNGFYFVGNNSKATLTNSGFYTGGDSSSSARHIYYTPASNGTLTVEGTASGANTDRYIFVATAPGKDETAESVVAKVAIPEKGTRHSVSVALTAGTKYYICLHGNGTVTNISYDEALTFAIEKNEEESTITITPSDLTAPYYCGVLNPTLLAYWSTYNDSMQIAFHASIIAEIESQAALEAAYRTGVQTIYMNDFADLGGYKVLAAAMHYDADAEGNINYFVIDSEVASEMFEIKEKENPGPTPETVTFEVVAGTTTFTVTPSNLEVEYYIDVVEAGTYSAENLKDFGMASVEEYFDFILKEMGSGLEYFSGVQTQSYEDDWYIDESGDYEIRIFAVSNEYKRISDISLTPFTFSDPTSLNAVESAVKAVAGKMMTDGKLTIVKNGVRYNAQGMMVK